MPPASWHSSENCSSVRLGITFEDKIPIAAVLPPSEDPESLVVVSLVVVSLVVESLVASLVVESLVVSLVVESLVESDAVLESDVVAPEPAEPSHATDCDANKPSMAARAKPSMRKEEVMVRSITPSCAARPHENATNGSQIEKARSRCAALCAAKNLPPMKTFIPRGTLS